MSYSLLYIWVVILYQINAVLGAESLISVEEDYFLQDNDIQKEPFSVRSHGLPTSRNAKLKFSIEIFLATERG